MEKEHLKRKYFQEGLNSEEQVFLDSLLERDPEFREEFEFEKDLAQMLKSREITRQKAKLQQLEEELESPLSARRPRMHYLAIAATVVLLLGLGWYISISNSMNSLYDEFYEVYPNQEITITRNQDDSDKVRAFSAYEAGDYTQAISHFRLLSDTEAGQYRDFYIGLSYLAMARPEQAVEFLQKAVSDGGEYQGIAKWYLSLAYLKKGEKEDASTLLREIANEGGEKATAAQELLAKLE